MTGRPPSRWARIAAASGLVALIGGGLALALAPGGPAPSPAPRGSTPIPTVAHSDVFVDPAGDDAADGTRASPLGTVEAALRRVPANGTVWLLPGRHAPFAVTDGGPRPVTIAGVAEEGVVVAGGEAQAAITIEGTSGVTVLDLAVDGPAGTRRAGVLIQRSRDVRLEGLTIAGVTGGMGIEVRFSSEVRIVRNDVSRTAIAVRLFGEGDPASVRDVEIVGNWLHDNDSMVVSDPEPDNDFGANGIVWHKVIGPTAARDNQLWNNAAPSQDYGVDGGAFEIWGSSNVEISGNTAWDNVNVLETGTDGPGCSGLRFLRNTAFATSRGVGLILRCAEDSLVAHNVLVGLRRYAFELSDRGSGNRFASSVDGLRIMNNIVADVLPYAIRNELAGTVTADRNVLWNPRGSIATLPNRGRAASLGAWQARIGLDAASVEADPRFVDAAGRDYRVLPDSPAVDLGEIVDGMAYAGAAPDAGRFEAATPPEASPP